VGSVALDRAVVAVAEAVLARAIEKLQPKFVSTSNWVPAR